MTRLLFAYRNEPFVCGAFEEGPLRYRTELERLRPWPGGEPLLDPRAEHSFSSEWDALRWAEQQTVRWAHAQVIGRRDRIGGACR
jgi:hypothetical protein